MSILAYCRRAPCTATPDETLRVAAQRMEKEATGFLAVTEADRLVGVLTDRDVTLHVAADAKDATVARVKDAMSHSPVAIDSGASVEDALDRMRQRRVRRLPVLEEGRIQGIVAADDLALLLTREIGGLAEVLLVQSPAGSSRAIGRETLGPRSRRGAEHYRCEVATTAATAPIALAARAMQERAVGSVLLLDDEGRAVGLVTDRDVALRVVGAGLDPGTTAASAVMSAPLVGAHPSDPLEEVVARMRTAGVRRIPILDPDGRPVGIVTFDDLLVAFGEELGRLADCVSWEVGSERARARVVQTRHQLEERIEEAVSGLRGFGDRTLRTLGRELDRVVDRLTHTLSPGRLRPRGVRITVGDLMQTDVRTCTPEDSLSDPARIMQERDCGCVPVVAADGSGRVVGMITDRDICMASHTSGDRLAELQVEGAMSSRVHSCHPEDSVSEAEGVMRTACVRRLPVVDDEGHLRGVLSLADLAGAAAAARAAVGSVSAGELGLVLEAICRPRNALTRR